MPKEELMRIILTALLFTTGCIDVNPALEDPALESPATELWVCHNLQSHLHGSLCSDECLFPGEPSSFCWLLEKSDCQGEQVFDWQKENCHLFGGVK